MKRKPTNAKIWWVKRIWPIFWKRCKVCDQDFRFEWGWRAMIYEDAQTELYEYVCIQCASTEQAVLKFCDIPPRALLRKREEADQSKDTCCCD